MRKIYIVLFAASIGIIGRAQEQQSYNDVPKEARKDLERYVNSMDLTMHDTFLQKLDSLDRAYPGTYGIPLATAKALERCQDLSLAIEKAKKIIGHPKSIGDEYSVIGNCYDILGKYDMALEYYNQGLARFPSNNRLRADKEAFLKRYNENVDWWLNRVYDDPSNPRNYYVLATTSSLNPAWAAIYAEEYLALEFFDTAAIKDAATILYKPIDRIKIEGKTVNLNVETEEELAPKSFMYNLSLSTALKNCLPFDRNDPKQIAEVRKQFVEIMYNNGLSGKKAVGDSDSEPLPIITYLKSIIDAGHWDGYSAYAYNYTMGKDLHELDEGDAIAVTKYLNWVRDGHAFVPDPTTYITQRPLKKD